MAPQLEHSVLVPTGVDIGTTVAPGAEEGLEEVVVTAVLPLPLLAGGLFIKAIGFRVVACV